MNKTASYSRMPLRPGVQPPAGLRLGTSRVTLLIVLGSETVFFGTVISAYLYLRATQTNLAFTQQMGAQLALPVANTLLLIVSALTAALAGRSIRRGNVKALSGWLLTTLVLGLVFVAGQAFDYLRSGMHPADQAFGGVFFTLMSFHALHMLAGVVVMAIALVRTRLGDFTARRHDAIDVGTGFWYYVVAVWVVLFAVLYLI